MTTTERPGAVSERSREPRRALLDSLEWRCIGPHRGGRVVAVAGDPVQPQVFYFGSTGGGVWKTTDGGQYWENVSDGYFKRASVGAIAVAESDPNIIYVGMGETTIRGNVSHGDGVYKSTDGGRTWQQMGLAETRHIAKIRVHPKNPDLVYVAALGHAHGPNEERGVYRSRDGGRTWEHVLFKSRDAGACDLAMDVTNPRVLYAAFWEARRGPHYLTSGGPGSGLWKTADGGDTWTQLLGDGLWLSGDGRDGSPAPITQHPTPVTLGKIGVAVSPANPERVWALIEAEKGGLYRSDDGGKTWELINEDHELRQRPWYYMHVYADPLSADTVYVLNLPFMKSTDGGKSFVTIPTQHGDNHDLWLDPRNPQRMIESNDGGAAVSFNGGQSWSTIYNQPTAEFYHVITDNSTPYRVYGSQQDNTAISLPSFSSDGAITQREWEVPGGGESGYIAIRHDDPNVVYGGSYSGYMTRYDRRSGQVQDITVWPENNAGWAAKDLKYRFQWTFPIHVSQHDPNVLFAGGNRLFRSTDEGLSWTPISPDLTLHDPETLEPSGGPITKDNISTEYYATIFAFAESPLDRNVLWTGSDDGLIHVSRDGGQSWQSVTPPDLPDWSLISIIAASPHDPATAYVAANRYKHDDFQPYLYKTSDYGRTWTKIVDGIPNDDFTRAIREDPKRRGLLYAGTETGIYVSFDDGARWERMGGNLPVVPIHDLVVKDDDLVLATHGRSFWILDDVTPLHGVSDEAAGQAVHLFRPRPAIRYKLGRGFGGRKPGKGKEFLNAGPLRATYYHRKRPTGDARQIMIDVGQNPPVGVVVTYYLRAQPEADVTLAFLDAAGNELRSFSTKAEAKPEPVEPDTHAAGGHGEIEGDEGKRQRPTKDVGINRFIWNMRLPDATNVPGAVFWGGGVEGPVVAPGAYQVRLTVGDQTLTETFEIRKDPRVPASQADLDAQYALLKRIHDRLSETHAAINRIRDLRRQIEGWERVAERGGAGGFGEAAKRVKERLSAIEEELIQVKAKAFEDTLNYPIKLNNKLASLAATVAMADAAPSKQSAEVFEQLSGEVEAQLEQLRALIDGEVPRLNALLRDSGMQPIVPLPA